MSFLTILAWIAVAFMVTISPGPDMLLVLGHAARNGTRAGIAATLGIVTGGLWFMALCGFGMMSILSSWPALFMTVKIVGALYLAWLGIGLIRGALAAPRDDWEQPVALDLKSPCRQGLLTAVTNPKVALFYVAALPQFVGHGPNAPLYGALLIGIHYLMGLLWLGGLSIVLGRARGIVRRTRLIRTMEALLGTFFIGFAGRLALARSH
jgi:threonine/homoserine/homoserine lactone efflux protein